jgi:hypothetical protein
VPSNFRLTTRVEHREPTGGSDGPGLCSSFEGVKRKGFPCPHDPRAREQPSPTTRSPKRASRARRKPGQVEQETTSLREDAEARIRSLQADIAAISDERRTLLDDIRRIAAHLEAIVAEAEPAEDETPPEKRGTPEPPAAVTNDAPPAGPNDAEAQDQRSQATRPSRET